MKFSTKILCLTAGLAGAFLLGGATVVCAVKHAKARRCGPRDACAAGGQTADDPIPAEEAKTDES